MKRPSKETMSSPCHSSSRLSRRLSCRALWAAIVLVAPLGAFAQTAITGWTVSNTDLTNTTAYSPTLTFQNNTLSITSFTAGTVKTTDSTATQTFVRRQGSGGNSNMWMIDNGSTNPTTFRGMDPSGGTLADVLTGNNILQGGNDLFVNTGGTPTIVNTNIERLDFYWNGGFTTVSDQGFAVFDRGRNDGFRIAIITGWDTGTNVVTTYGYSMTVGAGSYGNALAANFDGSNNGNTETAFSASALRYATNGTLSVNPEVTEVGDTIGGVFVSFASLGIPDGTRIYGYSLMATDVNTNNLANLVDWNNTTYYTNTSGDNANTSLDLVAFNGRRFVPEPSTYGAMLIAAVAAFIGWRRRQPALVPVKVKA